MIPGTQLAHYEILSAIGKGGMGEVWKARDTKLGREVAVKTLPPEFAEDPDRLARFEREAKLLASLNHPNIAAIYGLEEHEGSRFLVLELVEGDTLADRLRTGAIPIEESLRLALQIADALEAAHEKGVIHRDLKPANIKVTPDGKVKVLDFGLAKAFAGEQTDANLSNSPTLSMQATQAGIILGTAAYMSPEQVEGEQADSRSDVWSFGVVLFEMLTGRQAFDGKTVARVLAAVLNNEPNWNLLPPRLHPRLRVLIERLLEKERNDRLSGISDARVEIQKVLADPAGVVVEARTSGVTVSRRSLFGWGAGALGLAGVSGATGWILSSSEEAAPSVIRFDHVLPAGRTLFGNRPLVAVSPDGSQFVYSGSGGLYVRRIDEREDTILPGTEGANGYPVFSPDGQSLLYVSLPDLRLMRIAAAGGTPSQLVALEVNPNGISWDTDDTILYQGSGGIMRVSPDGTDPVELVPNGEGGVLYGYPQMLPEEQAILLTTIGGQIAVQSLGDNEELKPLFPGFQGRYLSTGHLVYAQGDSLFGVGFDLDTLEPIGERVRLLDGMRAAPPQFSISRSGTLAFVPGSDEQEVNNRRLARVDRQGSVNVVELPPSQFLGPRVSPDGSQLAVEIIDAQGNSAIWIYDLVGDRQPRRLTFPNEGNNTHPVWTADGQRITFSSDRDGAVAIYWQATDRTEPAERLVPSEDRFVQYPESWSPNGVLSFARRPIGGGGPSSRLWTYSQDTDEIELFSVEEGVNGMGSVFSPNGEWLAYTSNRTVPRIGPGGGAIYIARFPRTSEEYEVASNGMGWPVWSRDGTQLFYRSLGGTDLRVVQLIDGLPSNAVAEEQFPIEGFVIIPDSRDYDTLPDGTLVVMLPADEAEADETDEEQTGSPRISVVVNWFDELKERVPVP